MNSEKEILILMEDGCTRSEAHRSLIAGACIFEDPEDWIQSLKDCDCYENETLDKARNHEYRGISMVKYVDHEYLIEYVL